MLAAFIEAALRSLVLASIVWVGLRIFRIHNVSSQRSTWTAVLFCALLMPLALPFTSHWSLFSLATIPAPASLDSLQSTLATALSAPPSVSAQSGNSVAAPVAHNTIGSPKAVVVKPGRIDDGSPDRAASESAGPVLAFRGIALQIPATKKLSFANIAVLAYFLTAAALLIRLLGGLASALHLWHSSTRVSPLTAKAFGLDFNLRVSHKVSTPVTIGSGILLPAGYTSWPEEKLRIVLAHERSHVMQHDFYLQILASLYTALTWFSPLGWWLKRKLADLGEAISDGQGLNAASDRSAYAEVLLEFAAVPRPTLIGVTMARPSSISRRIERLLSDSYLRHAFAGGLRPRVAVLVVPVVLFAASAFVRVQAATQPHQAAQVHATSGIGTQTLLAPPISPALPAAAIPPAPRELALAVPPATPAGVAPPEGNAQFEASFDRTLSASGTIDLSVSTGSGNIKITRGASGQVKIHGVVKSGDSENEQRVHEIAANPPIVQDGNAIHIGEQHENLHNVSIDYEIEAPAETTLKAASGSGNIDVNGVGQNAKFATGSGNITAVGLQGGFKIETGSGNIAIDGSGQGDAKAQTGSGNIDLKGVHGALIAQTGSGEIKAAGTPSSTWRLEAGSGSIELTTGNAPMNLDASTGSGTISTVNAMTMQTSSDRRHVRGQLNGGGPEVRVETGSGDVKIH
jgi:beta-lactamase regulating signal transducer with metallopeptidase domain